MALRIRKLHAGKDSKAAAIFERFDDEKTVFSFENRAMFGKIETAITRTNDMGRMPLWKEYQTVANYGRPIDENTKRKMVDVRTKPEFCEFYAWLVNVIEPDAVLEFGAGFGASGMYWLAGMGLRDHGKLFSFEPNDIWHPIARANFDTVSDRHELTLGTFEDNIDAVTGKVNIAVIDAIHTREFVVDQFAKVRTVAESGALVLFADINFSDDMKECWSEISQSEGFASVWQLSNRVGIVELP